MAFDLLIRGGTVVDGSGREPAFPADVGIAADRIAAVGRLEESRAATLVDATGLVVCPGFIDVHVHSEIALLGGPHRYGGVLQGVTTHLTAADGFGWAPRPRDRARQLWEYGAALYGPAAPCHTERSYPRVASGERGGPSMQIAPGSDGGERRWRAGVVGLRRGLSFVRLFAALADVEVVALADPDSEARAEGVSAVVAAGAPAPLACESLPELLDVPSGVDLIVLATPGPAHVAGAELALGRGVHVLCEIPAAWSREECDRLVAAVEASTAQYMLAENVCYAAWVDAVRRLHERGAFGTVFHGEAEYIHNHLDLTVSGFWEQGAPTWRAGMEPIRYLTHDLGPLMWITGQYPTEVVCLGTGGHFAPEVVDLQTALVRMTDGGLVRITCSFANAHWAWHRYTLYGTRASLDTGWVGRDQPRLWTRDVPHLQEPVCLPLGTDVPGAPAAARLGGHGTSEWYMVRAFLDSLAAGTQPPVDVYDAVMYSLPGICAVESAASGGGPVSIPQYQWRRSSARPR